MTIHKLKLTRGWRFHWWLLCAKDTNNLIDGHKWSWLWSRVTCPKCREIGGRG